MTTLDLLKEVDRKIKVLNDCIAHFPDVETWIKRRNYYRCIYSTLVKINELENIDSKA